MVQATQHPSAIGKPVMIEGLCFAVAIVGLWLLIAPSESGDGHRNTLLDETRRNERERLRRAMTTRREDEP